MRISQSPFIPTTDILCSSCDRVLNITYDESLDQAGTASCQKQMCVTGLLQLHLACNHAMHLGGHWLLCASCCRFLPFSVISMPHQVIDSCERLPLISNLANFGAVQVNTLDKAPWSEMQILFMHLTHSRTSVQCGVIPQQGQHALFPTSGRGATDKLNEEFRKQVQNLQ